MTQHHARKNAVREQRSRTGQTHQAALHEVRTDRLAHRAALKQQDQHADDHEPLPKLRYDTPVPPELASLVRYHAAKVTYHLNDALCEGHYNIDCFAEWQRSTLYRLTDSLEYLHLLIGTIAAYLRADGATTTEFQRFLQVPDARAVENFITPRPASTWPASPVNHATRPPAAPASGTKLEPALPPAQPGPLPTARNCSRPRSQGSTPTSMPPRPSTTYRCPCGTSRPP
ncbi:hypothetical protein OG946_00245 [Streptomyces sp. NBC_01808]|uniref:hypothetical protein n=1 Tax=Streptomyces sp. NBC_01808 TaxID=2975947 RepID=UPI002DDC6378|nr:hypothetical protein [Streptomyces sp. NBC_01808]WSA35939.1 hypothetical protein OG946_00245 [Streptomyces sp. NBC_01808]